MFSKVFICRFCFSIGDWVDINKGKFLVGLARRAIEGYLESGEKVDYPKKDWLLAKRGVFTTIKSYPSQELRGCIGFPYPVMPLGEAVVESAISAATQDPRFPPVSMEELDSVVLEVTVLTVPKLLGCAPEDRPSEIVLGKHGLIAKRGVYSGLLLPQVPDEVGWRTVEEFLDGVCVKAGMPPGCWRDRDTEIYTFEGEIFGEKEPKGGVYHVA